MSSCIFSELAPGGVNCSGNGLCDETIGQCVCEQGWRNFGEFVFDFKDCEFNILTLRVLWGMVLLVFGIATSMCVYYMGILISIRGFKGPGEMYRYLFLSLFCSLCFVITAIAKVSSNDYPLIGDDAFITVLFGLGGGIWWATIVICCQRFQNFVELQARSLGGEDMVAIKVPVKLCYFFCLVHAMSPMLCLFDHDNCAEVYHRTYLLSVVPLQIALGMYWNYKFNKKLSNDIKNLIKNLSDVKVNASPDADEPYRALVKKLDFLFSQGLQAAVFNMLVDTTMVLWPFLLRKFSYLVPFLWSSAGVAGCFAIYLMCNSIDMENKRSRGKTRKTRKESAENSAYNTSAAEVQISSRQLSSFVESSS